MVSKDVGNRSQGQKAAQHGDFNRKTPFNSACARHYITQVPVEKWHRIDKEIALRIWNPGAGFMQVCSVNSRYLGGPKYFKLRISRRGSSTGRDPRHRAKENTNAKGKHLYPWSQRLLTNKMPMERSCPGAEVHKGMRHHETEPAE